MMITPGGARPTAVVRALNPGEIIRLENTRSHILSASRLEVAVLEPQLLLNAVPLSDGWISYASWDRGLEPIARLSTTWEVPAEPRDNSDQLVYLFNGLTDANGDAILQPVLQWGTSGTAGGSGHFWSVASWYVEANNRAFHTPHLRVNVGDSLTGLITVTGQFNGTFNYLCEFVGLAQTKLAVEGAAELTQCVQALEAYSLASCDDYPESPSTLFGRIRVQTESGLPNGNWVPVDQVTDCGQRTVVNVNSADNGEVEIFYR